MSETISSATHILTIDKANNIELHKQSKTWLGRICQKIGHFISGYKRLANESQIEAAISQILKATDLNKKDTVQHTVHQLQKISGYTQREEDILNLFQELLNKKEDSSDINELYATFQTMMDIYIKYPDLYKDNYIAYMKEVQSTNVNLLLESIEKGDIAARQKTTKLFEIVGVLAVVKEQIEKSGSELSICELLPQKKFGFIQQRHDVLKIIEKLQGKSFSKQGENGKTVLNEEAIVAAVGIDFKRGLGAGDQLFIGSVEVKASKSKDIEDLNDNQQIKYYGNMIAGELRKQIPNNENFLHTILLFLQQGAEYDIMELCIGLFCAEKNLPSYNEVQPIANVLVSGSDSDSKKVYKITPKDNGNSVEIDIKTYFAAKSPQHGPSSLCELEATLKVTLYADTILHTGNSEKIPSYQIQIQIVDPKVKEN